MTVKIINKRRLSVIVASILILSLVACGENTSITESSTSEDTSTYSYESKCDVIGYGDADISDESEESYDIIGFGDADLPKVTSEEEDDVSIEDEVLGTPLESFRFTEKEDGTLELAKLKNYSLSDIIIPRFVDGKEVTSIGNKAFDNWRAGISVVMPDSVTFIDEDAFRFCIRLKSIYLSSNLQEIGPHAFDACEKLEEIVLPDSLTSIERAAFYRCFKLSSIKFSNNLISIGKNAFEKCWALEKMELPNSLETIGDLAFYDCEALKSFSAPDSLLSIGEYAFTLCAMLSDIYISDSVKEIGTSAFAGCNNLYDITIPENVTNIGSGAFSIKNIEVIRVKQGSYADGWTITHAAEQQRVNYSVPRVEYY